MKDVTGRIACEYQEQGQTREGAEEHQPGDVFLTPGKIPFFIHQAHQDP